MDRENTINLINLYARTGGFDLEPLYPTRDSKETYNKRMQNVLILSILGGEYDTWFK